ncbi:MAG: triose-phosphate isomerase [Chloroflexota bacterium]|nr:triose-phosphate isomerase [Chloroflexota bacterium]
MSRRIPIIAANWKMHTTSVSARELCRALRERIDGLAGVEKVVCPPFVFLAVAAQELAGSSIKVGAQNVYWEKEGAFTGEISPSMLADLCEYVIIGHSERRKYFGETDETVNRRLKAALAVGLRPILCVGETLEERQASRTEEVLLRQVRQGLAEVDISEGFVVAYEPVWAIGTGVPASGSMANEAIGLIRGELAALYGRERAEAARIQYGGSVDPKNIGEFMSEPEIDGALVGGASLRADAFAVIVEQSARIKGARQWRGS